MNCRTDPEFGHDCHQSEEGSENYSSDQAEATVVLKPGPWISPPSLPSEDAATRNSPQDVAADKCRVKGDHSSGHGDRIRLQDYIPESLVIDYKARDMRSLELTGFHQKVTILEVKLACKDAVQICHKFGQGCKLLSSTALFENEQKALEAAKVLTESTLRGCAINVVHCGARWNDPKHSPEVLDNTLVLHGVPEEFHSKKKLATFFPTGHAVGKFLDGRIQVKFPNAIELIKAVKDPRCWTIGGEKVQFALAIAKKNTDRQNSSQNEHPMKQENSEKPICSPSKSSD